MNYELKAKRAADKADNYSSTLGIIVGIAVACIVPWPSSSSQFAIMVLLWACIAAGYGAHKLANKALFDWFNV